MAVKHDTVTKEIIATHALFEAIRGLTGSGEAQTNCECINSLASIGQEKTEGLMDLLNGLNSQGGR